LCPAVVVVVVIAGYFRIGHRHPITMICWRVVSTFFERLLCLLKAQEGQEGQH